jgi:hypothetical protein
LKIIIIQSFLNDKKCHKNLINPNLTHEHICLVRAIFIHKHDILNPIKLTKPPLALGVESHKLTNHVANPSSTKLTYSLCIKPLCYVVSQSKHQKKP